MSRRVTPKYRQTVFAPQSVDYVPGLGPSTTSATRFIYNRRAQDVAPTVGKVHDLALDPDKRRHVVWPTFGMWNRGNGVFGRAWFRVILWLQQLEVATLNLTWFWSDGTSTNFRPDQDPPLPANSTGPGAWPSLSIGAYNSVNSPGLTVDVPAYDLAVKADRAEMHLDFLQSDGTGWAWISGLRIMSLGA